jgi:hypothetical protein
VRAIVFTATEAIDVGDDRLIVKLHLVHSELNFSFIPIVHDPDLIRRFGGFRSHGTGTTILKIEENERSE